jgi:hypothetical protein
MGKALKLVKKIKQRQKYLKLKGGGFDRKDKMDQSEERMARSEKAYSALLRPQRRLDRNFGINFVADEPKISKKEKIATIERFDFGVSDFGIRLTLDAGLIADMHLAVGDVVRFLNGDLKGMYLKVVAIPDSTHIRLEDVASYVGPESDKIARFQPSDVKASYK